MTEPSYRMELFPRNKFESLFRVALIEKSSLINARIDTQSFTVSVLRNWSRNTVFRDKNPLLYICLVENMPPRLTIGLRRCQKGTKREENLLAYEEKFDETETRRSRRSNRSFRHISLWEFSKNSNRLSMKRQKRRETLFETEPNDPNDLFPDFSFFHQPRKISKSNITVPEIFAIFFVN